MYISVKTQKAAVQLLHSPSCQSKIILKSFFFSVIKKIETFQNTSEHFLIEYTVTGIRSHYLINWADEIWHLVWCFFWICNTTLGLSHLATCWPGFTWSPWREMHTSQPGGFPKRESPRQLTCKMLQRES